jgi:hypothetical protein
MYPLNRRLGGHFREEKIFLTLPVIKPRLLCCLTHRLVTILIATSRLMNLFQVSIPQLFVCFLGVTIHCGCIFHSPVAGFSLLVFSRFFDHTQRCATVGRTPLDEWSIHRRDLYLTTHNTHNRQTSMPSVGFEPTILADEQPKVYALDRTATGTGIYLTVFRRNGVKPEPRY